MGLIDRRHFVAGTAAALAVAGAPRVWSQPAGKAVRLVVPFPAAGGTDVAARLLADLLRTRYAPTIIVENRVGGGGRIGIDSVKNADADGSVLLFTPDFPLTLYPHIYRKISYGPRDFAPVAPCGMASMAIAAGPGLPAGVKTVAELVQWCKANPKLAAYASPSAGSTAHFAGMLFGRATGLDLLHVAYKGGQLAMQDLLGGQVPFGVIPLGEILPHLGAGRVRVLATTGPTRSRFTPDVPSLVEAGYKDVVVQSWVGMFVPAATPPGVVTRLNGHLVEILKLPQVQEALARFGFESAEGAPPAVFAARVNADFAQWAGVVRASGFSAED